MEVFDQFISIHYSMALSDSLFNLGTKSGLPRFVGLLCLIQAGVLFIPDSAALSLGFDAIQHIKSFPTFVQYYVNESNFKTAILIFWVMSPITLFINTVLFMLHINGHGYAAYLARRSDRLKKKGKATDYSIVFGILIVLLVCIWGIGINLNEPLILGNHIPAKNRLVMLVVFSGSISLFFPAAITFMVTELRANISE